MLAIPENCQAIHGPVPVEKTRAEQEAEERLTAAAEEWLRLYGQKAVHVANQSFSFGRVRILDYAERHGCPIPDEYQARMNDLQEFLDEASRLVLRIKVK